MSAARCFAYVRRPMRRHASRPGAGMCFCSHSSPPSGCDARISPSCCHVWPLGMALPSVLREPLHLVLGDRVLHHRHDVRLLIGQVDGDGRVHAFQGGEDGRGIRCAFPMPPGGKRPIELGQVHQQFGMLRLHPLDVRRAGRRAFVECVPQPLVLALVMRVEADRHRLELRRRRPRRAPCRPRGRRSRGRSLRRTRGGRGDGSRPSRWRRTSSVGGDVAAGGERCRGHGSAPGGRSIPAL